ncbi:hypothetical protein CKO38_02530 [Rhodospirillum rubrum]|uniref:hypothetical protein n=1 Tax=Rhodospirillum rubrum TaxID=1085 RepID=UPI0019042D45|nr:hypothetical protein [Rhodospirillum rubrum]MBK1663394.1 hypothetical protein [Rhodospirillum rubrum]MBK1675566.1 hypothetical protein [Rhodospirillum rubrum]
MIRPAPSLGLWLLLVASSLCLAAPVQAQSQPPAPKAEPESSLGRLIWHDDAPENMKGVWAVSGRCKGDTAEMLIFSNGGYRWRKSDGSWGFARGKFSYASPKSYRVLFKVSHLFPTEGYDAIVTISGNTLTKTNLKSNSRQSYRRCQN